MYDKKRSVSQILGPEHKEQKGEGASPLQVIAGELIEAVKSGDSAAVAEALKAAFTECTGTGEG